MEQFYIMRPTSEAEQWSLGLTETENSRLGFLEKYQESTNQLWELDSPLSLLLWFKYLDNPAYKNLGFSDIVSWKGDVMHKPPVSGSPSANFIVISKKVKSILDESSKPEHHRFHELLVQKEDDGEEKTYFAFQLTNTLYKDIDYAATTFSLKLKKDTLKEYEKGEISSYSHFLKKLKDIRSENRRAILVPNKLAVLEKKQTDILCGLEGEVLMKENIKKKIESLSLIGLEFIPFKKYEINF